jgi:hypothetical protein
MIGLACYMMLRLIQRGYFYRLCSASSDEERAGLKDEGEEEEGGANARAIRPSAAP